MKPVLTVSSKSQNFYHMWPRRMISKLENSGIFEVREENFPVFDFKALCGNRHSFIGWVKLNDVLIAIDAWDGPNPTCQLAERILADEFYSKTKIIFKIQYRPNKIVAPLKKFKEETGILLSNWSMFHSAVFPLEYYQWNKNDNHRYLTYISGKRRQGWMDHYKDSLEVATFDNCQGEKVKKGRPKLVVDDFLKILKECKWGLSLAGKRVAHMDCKNRREVEFSSCGMPLILNYVPEYPFPFEKNKHYVYIDNPADLMKIKDIDPIPYHEASVEAYNKYFSDYGSSQLFIDLVDKLLITDNL